MQSISNAWKNGAKKFQRLEKCDPALPGRVEYCPFVIRRLHTGRRFVMRGRAFAIGAP
jgi:hypothetical protein